MVPARGRRVGRCRGGRAGVRLDRHRGRPAALGRQRCDAHGGRRDRRERSVGDLRGGAGDLRRAGHRDIAGPAHDEPALAGARRRRGRGAVRPERVRAAGSGGEVSTADAVAGVLWIGATLYAVFGGADFGAGLWTLLAGTSERGRRARRLVDWAIGPVWEANHVWLIFVLVVLWTSFPDAFASVMSTLFIPLSLAALGIVLRGSGFAFHEQARRLRYRRFAELIFDVSSLLTPFFMGTVVGAIASGQVPVGNAAGDPVSSWTGPAPILTGALFVATGAYLSAVFLVSDGRRALAAAVAAGALAVAGLLVYRADARYIYDGLVGDALPLVIVSALCGAGVLAMLWRGGRRGIRPLAVGAVVAVIWGWGVAQHPYLLPKSLTISQGAAGDATLDATLIVFGIAVVTVLPSLGFLYTLTQRSVLGEGEGDSARRPLTRAEQK